MLWGILLTMLIGIPMGITEFNGIVSIPPSLEPVFFKFDFSKVLTTQMAFTVFTLLFIDCFSNYSGAKLATLIRTVRTKNTGLITVFSVSDSMSMQKPK